MVIVRAHTAQEIVMDGLLGTPPPPVEIRSIAGKGRGVFIKPFVAKGGYLLEYEIDLVYRKGERPNLEEEYEENNQSCMVIDILTKKGWVTLDATRMAEAIGRLMNHALASQATAKPFKTLILGGAVVPRFRGSPR